MTRNGQFNIKASNTQMREETWIRRFLNRSTHFARPSPSHFFSQCWRQQRARQNPAEEISTDLKEEEEDGKKREKTKKKSNKQRCRCENTQYKHYTLECMYLFIHSKRMYRIRIVLTLPRSCFTLFVLPIRNSLERYDVFV